MWRRTPIWLGSDALSRKLARDFAVQATETTAPRTRTSISWAATKISCEKWANTNFADGFRRFHLIAFAHLTLSLCSWRKAMRLTLSLTTSAPSTPSASTSTAKKRWENSKKFVILLFAAPILPNFARTFSVSLGGGLVFWRHLWHFRPVGGAELR